MLVQNGNMLHTSILTLKIIKTVTCISSLTSTYFENLDMYIAYFM